MNKMTWTVPVILLVIGLGCGQTKHPHITSEPNIPPDSNDISIENNGPAEPNTPTEPVMYTLSGSLGVEHVTLKGLPGDPNTQANGTYRVQVESGWSGTVTPQKEGFIFIPPSRTYLPFTQNIHHEIYIPQKIQPLPPRLPNTNLNTLILTGTLRFADQPASGITIRTLAINDYAITDANGVFELEVPANWKGTLRLEAVRITKPNEITPEVKPKESQPTTQSDPNQAVQTQEDKPSALSTPQEPFLITLGTSDLSNEAKEELKQDLKVMCQLLSDQAYGISLVKSDPNLRPKAIYVPQQGVIFNICLDWPLAHITDSNIPDTSTQWQKARNYTEKHETANDPQVTLHLMKTRNFTQKMVYTLRHAAQIRHLKDTDTVTVNIWGPSPSKTLIIQTSKQTIDTYEQGRLNDKAFESKVELKLH